MAAYVAHRGTARHDRHEFVTVTSTSDRTASGRD
jgi:hypothetical protein